MLTGLRPFALPTARGELPTDVASDAYVSVAPQGILQSRFQTHS